MVHERIVWSQDSHKLIVETCVYTCFLFCLNLDPLKKGNVIDERTWEFHLVEDGFYSTLDEGNKGLAFIHVMGCESIYYIRT